MTLRLAHTRQVACWPWELRDLDPRRPLGAVCQSCRRDVALPAHERNSSPVCIYCALDSGLREAVDRPIWWTSEAAP